ncbi:hypothetical protein M2262_002574 [Pseudomonas sp. BIGb0408]|nr:hypothetical protein [Pseudomonas sp. BIGb0408]
MSQWPNVCRSIELMGLGLLPRLMRRPAIARYSVDQDHGSQTAEMYR